MGFFIAGTICYKLFSEKGDSSAYPNGVETIRYEMALGSCTYIGELDANKIPHGQGEAKFDDGRYYKGEWVHGQWTDFNDGYFRDSNGDTFEGSFDENKFFWGTYKVASDGRYYEGEFFEGKPDHGEWYDKNGNVIETVRIN